MCGGYLAYCSNRRNVRIKQLQEVLKSGSWLWRNCITSAGVFYFEPPCRSCDAEDAPNKLVAPDNESMTIDANTLIECSVTAVATAEVSRTDKSLGSLLPRSHTYTIIDIMTHVKATV